MATEYDNQCNNVLKPLPKMEECKVRNSLDKAVSRALGLDMDLIKTIKRELSREPTITQKRYGEVEEKIQYELEDITKED